MITVSIFFLTFSVLGAGGEPAGLFNVYSHSCDTSDSRAAVMRAADPDVKELWGYNLTVEQFDTDTVSTYFFVSNTE